MLSIITALYSTVSKNILPNWRIIVLLLALSSGWWYVHNLHTMINEKDQIIGQLTARNSILVDNQQILTDSLTNINQSIGLMARGALETQAQFASLSSTVGKQTNKLSAQLTAAQAEKKPVDCTGTIKYLIDAIPEYSK